MTTYLGYFACLLLLISLLEKNELRFRWFNTSGEIVFIVYGVLLDALPVIATNTLLMGVNIYCLYKLYSKKELFELIEIRHDDIIVEKFIAFNENDIRNYFPEFEQKDLLGNLNFIVLRDMAIANILSVKPMQNGKAEVKLNYTIPRYRDFKIGKFIFEQERSVLVAMGISHVYYYTVANRKHKKFLKVTGFETDGMSYIKNLSYGG